MENINMTSISICVLIVTYLFGITLLFWSVQYHFNLRFCLEKSILVYIHTKNFHFSFVWHITVCVVSVETLYYIVGFYKSTLISAKTNIIRNMSLESRVSSKCKKDSTFCWGLKTYVIPKPHPRLAILNISLNLVATME